MVGIAVGTVVEAGACTGVAAAAVEAEACTEAVAAGVSVWGPLRQCL